jgi:hypothetical protein
MGEMRNTLQNFGCQVFGNLGIGGKVIFKVDLRKVECEPD